MTQGILSALLLLCCSNSEIMQGITCFSGVIKTYDFRLLEYEIKEIIPPRNILLYVLRPFNFDALVL